MVTKIVPPLTTKQEFAEIVAAWASGKEIEIKAQYHSKYIICAKSRPPSYDPYTKYRVYVPPVVENHLYAILKDNSLASVEELSKGGLGVSIRFENNSPVKVSLVKGK